MKRTQIQLDEDKHSKLREVAAQQGRSVADCIREGIDLFLRRSESRTADIDAVAGKFPPKPASGLKRHDRWLAEAILEDGRSDSR
ncbi:MAG: plasmid partition protein ParG [Armatimonadota bacterium]|jgi:hypothetical protein